jgi:hypothetical protein
MNGMTVIVKTVTRWLKVFIFLYGIYIIITGHLAPGGGFAGGVIIACSYMLLTLAYGKEFTLKRLSLRAGHRCGPLRVGIRGDLFRQRFAESLSRSEVYPVEFGYDPDQQYRHRFEGGGLALSHFYHTLRA